MTRWKRLDGQSLSPRLENYQKCKNTKYERKQTSRMSSAGVLKHVPNTGSS